MFCSLVSVSSLILWSVWPVIEWESAPKLGSGTWLQEGVQGLRQGWEGTERMGEVCRQVTYLEFWWPVWPLVEQTILEYIVFFFICSAGFCLLLEYLIH